MALTNYSKWDNLGSDDTDSEERDSQTTGHRVITDPLEAAVQFRARGNDLFEKSKWDEAIELYT